MNPTFYAWQRQGLFYLSREPADIPARKAETFETERDLMERFAKKNRYGRYRLMWERREPKRDEIWRD